MADHQDSRRGPAAALRQALSQVKVRDIPRVPTAIKAAHVRVQQVLLEASKDDDTPEGRLPLDRHAKAVYDAAMELAAGPGTDDAALDKLRRLARKHPDALRVAEIESRAGGRFRDFAVDNRAQRLLDAARSGRGVRPASEAERQRIGTIGPFSALPAEEQWRQLRLAEPGLNDLWADAVGGRFLRPEMGEDMTAEELSAARQEMRRRYADLQAAVRQLVGPEAHPDNPLVGSRYVENFVKSNLPAGRAAD